MFFEGAEKKAEVQIHNTTLSLLNDICDEFWHQLVTQCEAKILSSIRNEHCKAFLLSESSLFVWDNRFLIITCGETKLINSVEYFIANYGRDVIKQLTYQRKNEYFSSAQPSCFGDDVKVLAKYGDGEAHRFGPLDGHHNFIYHSENQFELDKKDKTYELLTYQISEQASKLLCTPNLNVMKIREFLRLDELLPDFDIDDFVFEPFGYSLNAIKDEYYFTIHVTPQHNSSYVSFESNLDLVALAPKIIDVLAPNSFDFVTYNEYEFEQKIAQNISSDYVAASKVAKTLSNGYHVNFCNFVKPVTEYQTPVKVSLTGDDNVL